MSRLRTRFLAAFLPQALGLGLPGEAIGRRGQMAIVAVFGQTALQVLDLCTQLFYLRFQWQQFCYQSTKRGIFFPKDGVFFSKRLEVVLHHVFTLLFSCHFGKGSRRPE